MYSYIPVLLNAFRSTNTLYKLLETQKENKNKYLENEIYSIILTYVTNFILTRLVEISK